MQIIGHYYNERVVHMTEVSAPPRELRIAQLHVSLSPALKELRGRVVSTKDCGWVGGRKWRPYLGT